jgi:hypothetical protein
MARRELGVLPWSRRRRKSDEHYPETDAPGLQHKFVIESRARPGPEGDRTTRRKQPVEGRANTGRDAPGRLWQAFDAHNDSLCVCKVLRNGFRSLMLLNVLAAGRVRRQVARESTSAFPDRQLHCALPGVDRRVGWRCSLVVSQQSDNGPGFPQQWSARHVQAFGEVHYDLTKR